MPQHQQLVASAFEFVKTSCDQYGDFELENARRLKHSTINLFAGIELLLKARLAQEHWTLLLQNPDRYRRGDWERGGFRSVNLQEAKARLSEICGFRLSEQADSAFTALSDLRNKLVHFMSDDSPERVTGIQLRAWHHVIDLLDHDFLQLDERETEELHSLKKLMLQREEILGARFEEVRSRIEEMIDEGSDVILCPFCGQAALAVGDGAQCLVCGSGKNEAQEYAEEYARLSAPWMSSDDYYNTQWAAMCSECRERACIVAPDELKSRCVETLLEERSIERDVAVEVEPWMCFNCGRVYDSFDIAECTRCGQLFGRNGDESLCPTCSW